MRARYKAIKGAALAKPKYQATMTDYRQIMGELPRKHNCIEVMDALSDAYYLGFLRGYKQGMETPRDKDVEYLGSSHPIV